MLLRACVRFLFYWLFLCSIRDKIKQKEDFLVLPSHRSCKRDKIRNAAFQLLIFPAKFGKFSKKLKIQDGDPVPKGAF